MEDDFGPARESEFVAESAATCEIPNDGRGLPPGNGHDASGNTELQGQPTATAPSPQPLTTTARPVKTTLHKRAKLTVEEIAMLEQGYAEGPKGKSRVISAILSAHGGLHRRTLWKEAWKRGISGKGKGSGQSKGGYQWTEEEESEVLEREGEFSAAEIAELVGRSEQAVRHRLWLRGKSSRVRDGLTITELAKLLHVRLAKLHRWIEEGQLTMRDARLGLGSLRTFCDERAPTLGINVSLLRQQLAMYEDGYTAEELAEIVRVPLETVRDWCTAGWLLMRDGRCPIAGLERFYRRQVARIGFDPEKLARELKKYKEGFTLGMVAEMAKSKPERVREWIRAGWLEYATGSETRISLDSLQRFCDQHEPELEIDERALRAKLQRRHKGFEMRELAKILDVAAETLRAWFREDSLLCTDDHVSLGLLNEFYEKRTSKVEFDIRHLGRGLRKYKEGYTPSWVARMTAVPVETVHRWLRARWLRYRDSRISDESFGAFCKSHWPEINLALMTKEEQSWLEGYRREKKPSEGKSSSSANDLPADEDARGRSQRETPTRPGNDIQVYAPRSLAPTQKHAAKERTCSNCRRKIHGNGYGMHIKGCRKNGKSRAGSGIIPPAA